MALNTYSSINFVIIIVNFIFFPLFSYPLSFNLTNFNRNQIIVEGDASVSSGKIQLNMRDFYFRVGRASYSEPLLLWDAVTGAEADFTTRFSFTIDTSDRNLTGDGLAFFLAPHSHGPIPPNSAGAGLGLLNSTTSVDTTKNQIVMVEFDTFPNVGSGDPLTQHVGINRNSVQSLVYKRWNASAYSGKPAQVWISYNASSNNLSVSWTYEDDDQAETTIGTTTNNFLSCNLNLKEVLPERVTIGFSASTGLYYETHTINSWEFSSNLEAKSYNKKGLNNKKLILAGTLVGVICVFVLLFVGLGFFCFVKEKRRSKKANAVLCPVKIDLERASSALPKTFSYQELVTATNGFADDRRLGRGGSGQVYKAALNDLSGRIVAVKRIFGESQQSSQRIFVNEVNVISQLLHRNLVKFIGWCHDQNELLLVYEYMPNGSLDTHLFGERKSLPWDVRYKIALGLASAIHYLHEEAERCVLHRDIKSANVLLDTDFSAKLGDFGVAKLVDTKLRTQRTALVGTFGYLAPEYVAEGRATKESDMYSFGVVALEIACGKRTYYVAEENDHVPLMRWVWELYAEGKIMEAADERLDMKFDENEMRLLLMVGLWCCHPRVKERPKASQVIRVLQFDAQLPELDPHDMLNVNYINKAATHVAPQEVSGSFQIEITSSIRNQGR